MLDALGILIGFVTVILVLSVVSTALVQMTSSLLRLRGRNLFRGLERVLLTAAEASDIEKRAIKEGEMDSKKLVEDICSSSGLLEIGASWFPNVPRRLRGPSRSWIDREELKEILDGMELSQDFKDKVDALFPRLEDLTKKRFGFSMRAIAVCWAIVIAVAFQVSAPDLLRDLSIDPEQRKVALDLAARVGAQRDLAGEALSALRAEREDLAEPLANVESAGPGTVAPISELRTALAEQQGAETIVARYIEILNALQREQVKESMGTLAKLDIALWSGGTDFYWTTSGNDCDVEWGNLLGVLMTATLLSLGAPFWFQMLHQLSGLRDALSPEKDSKAKGGPSQPQPAQIQVQVVGPAPPEAPAAEGANPEAPTAERDR